MLRLVIHLGFEQFKIVPAVDFVMNHAAHAHSETRRRDAKPRHVRPRQTWSQCRPECRATQFQRYAAEEEIEPDSSKLSVAQRAPTSSRGGDEAPMVLHCPPPFIALTGQPRTTTHLSRNPINQELTPVVLELEK